jgi:RNA polymerase sigma-70 factor (ECF subfamily)
MSESLARRKESFGANGELVAAFGFVPNLSRAQSELPRAIDAEDQLIGATLVREGGLTRRQKEGLLHGVASAWRNSYCLALSSPPPPAESEKDTALLKFALKLTKYSPWFSGDDVETLRGAGFDDAAILEAVATTAVGQMLRTLADGLCPAPDPERLSQALCELTELPQPFERIESPGPYLPSHPHIAVDFPPYAYLREQLGFIPNFFLAQDLRPDLVEAEVYAFERILFPEDFLSRVQKENILLVISAANLNTYFVAVHSQILSALGVPEEDSDQIIEDHNSASLSSADRALLGEVRKLACTGPRLEDGFDGALLRAQGFTEPQITEAVAMSALTNFLNTLQTGLGAVPDFSPRHVFTPKDLYPSVSQSRLTSDAPSVDPDAVLVARVQSGETDAFEELVRRHSRRIFGILAGLVGNLEDARDAVQDVFMKAFEHIDRFQGRSKFSTWLVSIAINTGTELLRQRKPLDPLEDFEDVEGFRPRQIQSWADNPEQLCAASQRSELVRVAVLRLPEKYRVAVLLRDINQLSTEEAAAALGLGVPALKARLLRGRLMLRESLAPHFIRTEKGVPDAQLR